MNTIETYNRDNPGKVWRTVIYDMGKCADIAKFVARTKFAFPGGYELFAITDDGAALCYDCCQTEFSQIVGSYPGDGWRVTAIDSMANYDDSFHCDHCNREIS